LNRRFGFSRRDGLARRSWFCGRNRLRLREQGQGNGLRQGGYHRFLRENKIQLREARFSKIRFRFRQFPIFRPFRKPELPGDNLRGDFLGGGHHFRKWFLRCRTGFFPGSLRFRHFPRGNVHPPGLFPV
jgi:hypothetical protein